MGKVRPGTIRTMAVAAVCAGSLLWAGRGVAASGAEAARARKPIISGAADARRAWLAAEYNGLVIHKVANRTDGSLGLDVRFGHDLLAIAIDAAGTVQVSRGKESVRVGSLEAHDRLQRLLAGSEAVLAVRLLLATRELTSDLHAPEMSLLSAAAFVVSLAGDVDAPRRLAARFAEKHRGRYRDVAVRTCFDSYSAESSAAWNDMQNCMDEANQDSSLFNRAYRRVGCNAIWLVRSESAWIEYLGCLGLGQMYQ